MSFLTHRAIGALALGALMTAPSLGHASDTRALEERLRQLEALVVKQSQENADYRARLRKLESAMGRRGGEAEEAKPARQAKGQAKGQDRRSGAILNAARTENPDKSRKDGGKSDAPPPVFVSFKNGIYVETEDKSFSFKVGGRVMVDGGGISQPLNGFSNQAGFRQIRLEVEGKAFNHWFYKSQYDFAGTGQILANPGVGLTGANQVLGGVRDMYFGLQHPALTLPFAKEPIYLMVGNMFEPFSLEASASSKYRDLIERALAVEGIAPNRHLGFAAGAYGDKWTAKAGVFTTSLEDASLNPAQNTPARFGVLPGARWVSTGGGQYVDVTGRATYAPIKDEHDLIHIGLSGRYHRPNDSTGLSNDRVLRLGNRLRSEATILGQGLLGTPDLSCGAFALPAVGATPYAAHCTRDVFSYGFEIAAAHGPFAMQAEYVGTDYYRNQDRIQLARLAGQFAPGGSRHHFDGFYFWGEYWLTGEERAAAYDVKDKTGANFGQIKIKNPMSAGGFGAVGLVARYSSINLNSGPISGSGLFNALAFTQFVAPNPVATAILVNSGVYGGRQENVTAGVNWYPENGVHLQANWTRVMHISAPLNDYNIIGAPLPTRQGAYFNGAHPNLFEVRAQVYW